MPGSLRDRPNLQVKVIPELHSPKTAKDPRARSYIGAHPTGNMNGPRASTARQNYDGRSPKKRDGRSPLKRDGRSPQRHGHMQFADADLIHIPDHEPETARSRLGAISERGVGGGGIFDLPGLLRARRLKLPVDSHSATSLDSARGRSARGAVESSERKIKSEAALESLGPPTSLSHGSHSRGPGGLRSGTGKMDFPSRVVGGSARTPARTNDSVALEAPVSIDVHSQAVRSQGYCHSSVSDQREHSHGLSGQGLSNSEVKSAHSSKSSVHNTDNLDRYLSSVSKHISLLDTSSLTSNLIDPSGSYLYPKSRPTKPAAVATNDSVRATGDSVRAQLPGESNDSVSSQLSNQDQAVEAWIERFISQSLLELAIEMGDLYDGIAKPENRNTRANSIVLQEDSNVEVITSVLHHVANKENSRDSTVLTGSLASCWPVLPEYSGSLTQLEVYVSDTLRHSQRMFGDFEGGLSGLVDVTVAITDSIVSDILLGLAAEIFNESDQAVSEAVVKEARLWGAADSPLEGPQAVDLGGSNDEIKFQ